MEGTASERVNSAAVIADDTAFAKSVSESLNELWAIRNEMESDYMPTLRTTELALRHLEKECLKDCGDVELDDFEAVIWQVCRLQESMDKFFRAP